MIDSGKNSRLLFLPDLSWLFSNPNTIPKINIFCQKTYVSEAETLANWLFSISAETKITLSGSLSKNLVCDSCRLTQPLRLRVLSPLRSAAISIRQIIVVGSLATLPADNNRWIADTRQQASLLRIPHSLLLPVVWRIRQCIGL